MAVKVQHAAQIISTLDMRGYLVHCCQCKDFFVWTLFHTEAKKLMEAHNA